MGTYPRGRKGGVSGIGTLELQAPMAGILFEELIGIARLTLGFRRECRIEAADRTEVREFRATRQDRVSCPRRFLHLPRQKAQQEALRFGCLDQLVPFALFQLQRHDLGDMPLDILRLLLSALEYLALFLDH
jgi:hypothetical protein